ncbi:MAG TPA: hypothetical protein EYP19_09095 [Desulfobacterales bacterium]|nr:hypothetical protein [Desulfobacterales bacterium]
MNIVFGNALSEAMYVATRRSSPETLEYFRDYFENMLWGYNPHANLERTEPSPENGAFFWECVITANRNDLVEHDNPEKLESWEFTWAMNQIRCDRFNESTAELGAYPDGQKKTHWMTGGLINHALSADSPADWSIHT